MNEIERVREEIADIINKVLFFGREVSDEWIGNQKSQDMPFNRERADQILSIHGIEIRADGQRLPDSTYYANEGSYRQAQQDMLKANFVKVVKK
jgi:hypothetical protein